MTDEDQLAVHRHPLGLSINNLADLSIFTDAGTTAGVAYFELFWDNFAHLPSHALQEVVDTIDRPVAFHVMWSRFAERDDANVRVFLDRLCEHIHAVNPWYVSDHVCRFTNDGKPIPLGVELDPERIDLPRWVDRIDRYQQAMGRQLLVENAASHRTSNSRWQIDLMADLQKATGCGLLFDISNAIVSHLNGGENPRHWIDLLAGSAAPTHAHIGGFRAAEGLVLDTHDQPVDEIALELYGELLGRKCLISTCLERDHDYTSAALVEDLGRLASVPAGAWRPTPVPDVNRGRLMSDRLATATKRHFFAGAASSPIEDGRWWTAPLMSSKVKRSAARTEAVRIWLINYDMRPHVYLVLMDEIDDVAVMARRSTAPGQHAMTVSIPTEGLSGIPVGHGFSFTEFLDDLAVSELAT